MGESYYTIGVYIHENGEVRREILNRGWRMSYMQASDQAAVYTERYADAGRTYKPVNVKDIPGWEEGLA